MIVDVYPDGAYHAKRRYSLPPPLAVVHYPHDVGAHRSYDLVVVPVDDEARALTGWQVEEPLNEGESAQFMLFKAMPKPLNFNALQVHSFNTTCVAFAHIATLAK